MRRSKKALDKRAILTISRSLLLLLLLLLPMLAMLVSTEGGRMKKKNRLLSRIWSWEPMSLRSNDFPSVKLSNKLTAADLCHEIYYLDECLTF
jgi:hypothetical protein